MLHGPSSAGKTSIATRLRMILRRPAVVLDGDRFDLPPESEAVRLLRSLPPDIAAQTEERFHRGYFGALASFAGSGLHAIGEVLFKSEQMFRAFEAATAGVPLLVVAVRCDDAVRALREQGRDDGRTGAAILTGAQEWAPPHPDLVVDTTHLTVAQAAEAIALRLG